MVELSLVVGVGTVNVPFIFKLPFKDRSLEINNFPFKDRSLFNNKELFTTTTLSIVVLPDTYKLEFNETSPEANKRPFKEISPTAAIFLVVISPVKSEPVNFA